MLELKPITIYTYENFHCKDYYKARQDILNIIKESECSIAAFKTIADDILNKAIARTKIDITYNY